MRVIAIFLALVALATSEVRAVNPPNAAPQALVQRLLPERAGQFVCEVIPADKGRDVFEIESQAGKIVLRGNNGVGIASALNWYLKYSCRCQISWCGDQLGLPNPLPAVKEKIRRVSPYTYRYAFNYCTFGYGMAFWDWKRWEREIDFMALNGINLPLAATGMEVAHRNVYRALGLSEEAIGKFISGPAYLPWFLMGNLDGFGGPLPESWFAQQEALQKKILARERELGMKPVLPAFSGHVPEGLQQKFPDAKIARLRSWGGFPGVSVLDPSDPLFRDIGVRFLREVNRLYGSDHIYSADTFNEVDPPTTDPEYLKNMAQQVYRSMADADPQAVWVMQGWLFLFSGKFWTPPRIESLLSGVPDDLMLILDLFADAKPQWNRTKAFAGKPWIWCIVHNWGGKQGMYGRLEEVGVGLPKVLGDPAAGKLAGIGTTNEGNEINPIIFDQMYEMAWRTQPMDVAAWVRDYVRRRYGKQSAPAQQAWEILATQLYDCKDNRHGPQGSFFSMLPGGDNFVRASIFYDTRKIRDAFRLLLEAADELGGAATYRYDVVDLGRQVMSDLSQQVLYREVREAMEARIVERFDKAAAAFLEALRDTDRLLATETLFQLGHYLEPARSKSGSAAECALYEQNARRLITLWGPSNSSLAGYAQRQYAGLMRDLYYERWKIYFDEVSLALKSEKAFKAPNGDAVRLSTEKWVNQRNPYPAIGEGDPIAEARKILKKYCPAEGTAAAAFQPSREDFIGRWKYTANNQPCVREFRADGSLHQYINGVEQKDGQGCTWSFAASAVTCRKADGTEFGKNRFQDRQTLLFDGEPYGPATKELQERE